MTDAGFTNVIVLPFGELQTDMIIEATKKTYVSKVNANEMYNNSPNNYNRYASSLLTSREFVSRLDDLAISYPPEES